jgi:hypothetical protein
LSDPDVCMAWARGNGGETVEKMYFANGKEAGRALGQHGDMSTYWQLVTPAERCGLWAVFSLA